jgi:four helix bundle protein
MKSFEELPIFKRAYKISLDIHRVSRKFPKDEQYSLADQLRRSSKSICANLAEGFAKQVASKKEFKRYVLIALGSSDETRVWLRYCYDLGYLDELLWNRLRKEYQEISKMLHSFYKSIN